MLAKLINSKVKILLNIYVSIHPYLPGSVTADEFIIDLLGLGWEFISRLGFPVILTGKVECDVLLAELRHQEGCESTQSI